jgi:hypothetical protein
MNCRKFFGDREKGRTRRLTAKRGILDPGWGIEERGKGNSPVRATITFDIIRASYYNSAG